MVLLPLRSVVLFPNESVPLRIRNHSYIAAIEGMLRSEGEGELGHRATSTSTASTSSSSPFVRRGFTDDTTATMNHSSTSTPTPSHLGIVNLSDSDTAITVGFVGTTSETLSQHRSHNHHKHILSPRMYYFFHNNRYYQ